MNKETIKRNKQTIKRNRKALGLSNRGTDVSYMVLINSIIEVFLVHPTESLKLYSTKLVNGAILADGLIVGFEEEHNVQ